MENLAPNCCLVYLNTLFRLIRSFSKNVKIQRESKNPSFSSEKTKRIDSQRAKNRLTRKKYSTYPLFSPFQPFMN